MKGTSHFYRNFAEEVLSRPWLYCRLIGGPAAGEIVEVKSDRDVLYVPVRSPLPPLDFKSNAGPPEMPKFTQVTYVRSQFLPTQFYYEDER